MSAVARRYAKAILELGLESGTVDTFVREIGDAAASFAASSEAHRRPHLRRLAPCPPGRSAQQPDQLSQHADELRARSLTSRAARP
jgi:hypothetical protein